MLCERCKSQNEAGAACCLKCGTRFPVASRRTVAYVNPRFKADDVPQRTSMLERLKGLALKPCTSKKLDAVLIAILVLLLTGFCWLTAAGIRGMLPIGLILALYFAPAIEAHRRKHRNRGAIRVLNLLLGWTVLGWVIALVWACSKDTESGSSTGMKDCPDCAESVKVAARKCRFCGHEFNV